MQVKVSNLQVNIYEGMPATVSLSAICASEPAWTVQHIALLQLVPLLHRVHGLHHV